MKLLIAIPSLDYLHVEFVRCLTALMRRLDWEGTDYDVAFEAGTLVYTARDKLCTKAVNGGYTHMLWLDGDMVFDEDILQRLLKSGRAFVSGVYYGRHYPYNSCVYTKLREGENGAERPDADEMPEEAFEIEGCGFGCVLIDTRIIKHLRMQDMSCFRPTESFGEDLAFCWRARKAGYHIICEPSAKCAHIGHVPIWPGGVKALRQATGLETRSGVYAT